MGYLNNESYWSIVTRVTLLDWLGMQDDSILYTTGSPNKELDLT